MDTLQAAKNDLRQGWETPKGAICGCCGQNVKIYRRQIYKIIAKNLINLYCLNKSNQAYYHMSKIGQPKNGGGDFAKLRYWGLIEQLPNDVDIPISSIGKKHSGYWKITQAGIDFVEDKSTVIKYCHVYNGIVGYRSGKQITIHDALAKEAFNYPELMGYLL